jgi:TPR repeat protein
MRRYARFALAAALVATAVPALARDGWQTMDFRDWRDMMKEAHAAYEREDYDKAFGLYARNACLGDKPSQFALGTMFLMGQGTQPDGMRAYAWYKVAAESGERDYVKAFKRVDSLVPAEHREASARLGDDYLARFGSKATDVSCQRRAEAGTKISELECKPPIDPRTAKIRVRMCEVPTG